MREPGIEDATRRTRLANERTFLAWWRTGLTSLALAVAVGRVVPEVSHTTQWPYELAGAGFGLLGVAFLWFGFSRARSVERALNEGSFAPFSERMAAVLLAAGLLLSAGTTLIVLFVH
jgi:putative membrane protein